MKTIYAIRIEHTSYGTSYYTGTIEQIKNYLKKLIFNNNILKESFMWLKVYLEKYQSEQIQYHELFSNGLKKIEITNISFCDFFTIQEKTYNIIDRDFYTTTTAMIFKTFEQAEDFINKNYSVFDEVVIQPQLICNNYYINYYYN